MNEAALVIGALLIACVIYGVFLLGVNVGDRALRKAQADLTTSRALQHNLNCLVGDLTHEGERLDGLLHEQNVKVLELRNSLQVERAEVKKFKPDAMAYHTCVGLWATDQPRLIQHHPKKERFFRIGYPEHKL